MPVCWRGTEALVGVAGRGEWLRDRTRSTLPPTSEVGRRNALGALMKNRVALTIALLLSTACEGGSWFPQLQARAALDFDCQPSAISARDVANGTVIAGGCGKRAIYVQTCSGRHGDNCVWLLNSPIRSTDNSAAQGRAQFAPGSN